MRARHRLRQVVNVANLSTPVGLVLAALGGATGRRSRNGLVIARGYRLPVPSVPAFTVGNVVLMRAAPQPGRDPVGSIPVPLLRHEERHATQYAWCGGVLMPALYAAAAAWSWLRAGDPFTANTFERRAGLSDGGYRRATAPARPTVRVQAGRTTGGSSASGA